MITARRPHAGLRREPQRQHARRRPRGKTLMPGLIEGHFHISFWGVRELPDLDLKLPAELDDRLRGQERRARAALRLHRRRQRGALHRVDVTIRDAGRGRRDRRASAWPPRGATSARPPGCSTGTRRSGSSGWTGSRSSPTVSTEVRKAVRAGTSGGCGRRSSCMSPARACCAPPGPPPEETMYSFEEIAGGGRGGAHAQPPDRRARPRQRRRQALRRGGHRRDRARDLRRRRGDRHDRRAEG